MEIPGRNGSLAHDIKDVPHGMVEYIHYYSNSVGTDDYPTWETRRRALIKLLTE